MLSLFKESTEDTLPDLIKKVRQVVKNTSLHPDKVQERLNTELGRQQDIILAARTESDRLPIGLAGFYEIVFKRPFLQYRVANQGRDMSFLNAFPRPLNTLIRSFAQTGGGISPDEGRHELANLAGLVVTHGESLASLYSPESEAETFLSRLKTVRGNEAGIKELYGLLRKEVIDQCGDMGVSSAGVREEQVRAYFDAKAAEIEATLPPQLRKPTEAISQQITAAWGAHRDHSQQALLYGLQTLVLAPGQLSGAGHFEGPALIRRKVNLHDRESIKELKGREVQERFEQAGKNLVTNFYESCRLKTSRLIAYDSVVKEELIPERQQGLATILGIVDYRIAEYIKGSLLAWGLSEEQKVRKSKEFAKEAVLFGLKNNAFSEEQRVHIQHYYPNLLSESEIQEAQNEARTQRQTAAEAHFEEEAAAFRRLPDAN